LIDPRAEYTRRLAERQPVLRSLRRRDALYANGRLVVFVALCAVGWAVFGPLDWPTGVLAIPMGAFIYLVVMHEWTIHRARDAEQAVRYYDNGIARLDDRWAGRCTSGEDLRPAEHLYAEDLDLFGAGSLFELLCTARTRAGEATLARWLCQPADKAEVESRQEAVRELAPELDLRERLWLTGGEARPKLRPELLVAWARTPRVLPGLAALLVAVAITLAVAAMTLAWAFNYVEARLILVPVLAALLFQWWIKNRTLQVLRAGDEPLKDLQVLAGVSRRIEGAGAAALKLRALQEVLTTDARPASAAIGLLARLNGWQESQRNAMFAPFALALLWNVHFAYAMEWWRGRYGVRVPAWLDAIGEFEALSALATYAFERPGDTYPELVEGGAHFDGAELGHPLLPAANCVRNSVSLEATKCLIVVSGSNMSGKSTLLRTVGINTVLALAGAPVRAKALRLAPMQIGASMHIIDSIQRGTSHFYAEILRLRGILEAARGPRPVLLLIDEILHGTNSHDRRIGSDAVLRGLVDAGAIGLVTTHDLALTQIVAGLNGRAENVHFVDHLQDGKLVFDYTMRPGVVERSNALALMRSIGLDV
jgi:hypothetical protein